MPRKHIFDGSTNFFVQLLTADKSGLQSQCFIKKSKLDDINAVANQMETIPYVLDTSLLAHSHLE